MKIKNNFWLLPFILIGISLMLATSCSKDDDNNKIDQEFGTVTDIDGNVYKTVKIGSQVWMAENLKTSKYRNGDIIPIITNVTDWYNLAVSLEGARCNNLYNWYAVSDRRIIAPVGWHIPTNDEWTTLKNYVSSNLGISSSVAKALASTEVWDSSPVEGAPGNDLTKNNSSGFTAFPSGFRDQDGLFRLIYKYCCFWSYNHEGIDRASYWYIRFNNGDFVNDTQNKNVGFSVRCVKD
jgi:uncharacterized protein (TIGR02145 family)